MLNILDAIIILILLAGTVLGFKRGIIQSAVMFFGTIVVIVLAYYLKNPLSSLLYTYLPFFKFSGVFEGVSVINILIYEAIAFLVAFSILSIALRLLVGITGILEKLLKATIVLGIPSKILGAIFGAIEAFVILFIILFCINQFNWFSEATDGSKFNNKILTSTPILSDTVGKGFNSVKEVYELKSKYSNKNGESYNKEALEIMLKNNVITPNSVRKLVEKGKINIKDIDSILNKYEEENNENNPFGK